MDRDHPSGGSRGLGELIDKYGEYLAADLLSEYNVDIRDVLVPGSGVTPRWLFVLIKGLPTTSRFVSEQRGGQQFRDWGPQTYATVAIVNAVRALQYTYVAAHSKQRPKPPQPFPIPDRQVRQANTPGSFAFIAASKIAAAKRKAGGA